MNIIDIKTFENYLNFEKFGKEAKSNFLDSLLVEEKDHTSKIVLKNLKPNLNISAKEILNEKSLKKLSKRFSIYFRQYKNLSNEDIEQVEEINNFYFFGLTIKDFKPTVSNCKNEKVFLIALSKMTDHKLIQNKLVKIFKQQLELQQIRRGKVNNYMSDTVYNMMLEDKKSVDEYLSSRFIQFKEEKRTLLELKELGKTNRMNELCVIKNHINKMVNDDDWGCRFITITNRPEELPRAYNKADKTHWNGVSTPSDNVQQLQERWRNIQSYANRNGIPLIGIWCREPHKKSGIHQHLLIFTKREYLENDKMITTMTKNQTKSLLGKYKATKKEILNSENITLEQMFLRQFGYTNRSCKIDVLTNQGKPQNIVNYITKYIMKTIDLKEYNGTSIEKDDENHINKVSFHRSLWQYRAYGFFGFKKEIGLWRMFQKIKNLKHCCASIVKDSYAEKALTAVKSGDFSAFLEVSSNLKIAKTPTETAHGETSYKVVGLVEFENNQVNTSYYFDNVADLFNTSVSKMLSSTGDFRKLKLPKYEVLKE